VAVDKDETMTEDMPEEQEKSVKLPKEPSEMTEQEQTAEIWALNDKAGAYTRPLFGST